MELYRRVKLLTNDYSMEGISKGSIGYIIEIYHDGKCEVDFSDPKTGITYAQVVIKSKDLEIND